MKYKANSGCHSIYSLQFHYVACVKYRHKIMLNNIPNRLKEINNSVAKKFGIEIIKENEKGLFRIKQQKLLKKRKKEDIYLKAVHSQVLQDVLFRVEKAFALFFVRLKVKDGKAGYPRYKSYNRYDSFTYSQQPGFKFTDKGLKLSKIGIVKIKLHRPTQGEAKTCTIKREIDRCYACFSCQVNFPIKSIPQRAIGQGLPESTPLEIANRQSLN